MFKLEGKKTELYLLIAILIFGAFLRLYHLGNAPLWVDESISMETARQITQTGLPMFESGMIDSRAYVFHYLQAFFLLFGGSELFGRLISVIFGLLTIVLGYRIGKEYSKSGGLITALLLCIFYLEVFFSRHARMYQMFQFFFFLSIYLLYKSKDDVKYLYFALISLVVCYDTQIAGLVLAPFFIVHILYYNRRRAYLCVIPAALLLLNFLPSAGLVTENADSIVNYATSYLSYAHNMMFMLVLSIVGLIYCLVKKRDLTLWIALPSILLLTGVFTLETFALRYAYFITFPLVLYASLLLSFLYEKYGKIMLIALLAVLLIPSNIFFEQTYTNVILPIDYHYNDYSAPSTDYKSIPIELKTELRESTLISLFSLDVKYYIRQPDYVIPFSMNGLGDDQISLNSSIGVVDRYSGSPILDYSNVPPRPYFVLADSYSVSKLKGDHKANFDELISNCISRYENSDLKVWDCK